ncbi:hypothetical protein N7527_000949 [Penicillium freii]|nr:hypothetical protein N7527_000949 [Penicillium freii]
MDAQTLIRRHDVLKNLQQRVNGFETFFLSPSELQGFGIRAYQVGITDDGVLQFHPCFFLPHPERVLQKYPIDTSRISVDGCPKLNNRPDFDSILKHVLITNPNAEDPFTLARESYEEIMLVAGPHEWGSRAHETQYYMSWHIRTCRKGRPTFFSLIGLGSLTALWRTKIKTTGPQIYERGLGLHWQIESLLEDSDESSPVPHAIMETIAHVPANHADQSLTLHEVRAIVNMMLIRTSQRPFRKYPIHPLLVLSYMGEQHGRIIQASFDGANLIYSILNYGASKMTTKHRWNSSCATI